MPAWACYTWVVVKIKVPFLDTLTNKCRLILGIQKGTIILTTTHMVRGVLGVRVGVQGLGFSV